MITRKEEVAKYGTWFGGNTSFDHILRRCDEQIANCEKWIVNLKQLKQEQLTLKAKEHEEELKAMLAAMTPEDREAFINGLNQQ